MQQIQELLIPQYLHSVKGLSLLAKKAVDVLLPGFHISKRTGAGMEFSNYRTYQAGDDLRMLDWKLYARSDRFYIREAEQEKHLSIQFIVDTSASMLHEDNGLKKIDYTRFLVATLGWLGLQQGDHLSLHSLNEQQITRLGPKPGSRFFQRLLFQLIQLECGGKFPLDLPSNFSFSSKREKSLILFFTDFYEHENELLKMLKQLKSPTQEIIVFHLMGQNELEMSFKGSVTLEDLETKQRVQLGNQQFIAEYKELLNNRLKKIEKQFIEMGIHYSLVNMQTNPGVVLQRFLKIRNNLSR